MRENPLHQLWAEGRTAVNGWLSIPSAFSAETMAHQGWNSLTIDMQHGVIDYQVAVAMMTAISTTNTVPLVRVPWLEPGILMKALDAGAYGVICPMVNNAEECEQFVSWTSYPPRGTRSNGPIRALLYAGSDYQAHANDTIVRFAMIETAEALDNLDEIMSVPGLDAIYIGPSDLSLALGCKPLFDEVDKPVAEAIALILAKAKEHGLRAGAHNMTPEYARKRMEMGFDLVTIASDARLMAANANNVLTAMQSS